MEKPFKFKIESNIREDVKVPNLICEDTENNVKYQITVNNKSGIRNSELLATYYKLGPKILKFVKLIKMWFNTHISTEIMNSFQV